VFFHILKSFKVSNVVSLPDKSKRKMKRIGLLSDTHGYWDERYLKYFDTCDEIWHAGDIGSLEVAERLAAFRPLRAVYGNIDGQDLRIRFPEINRFQLEGTDQTYRRLSREVRSFHPKNTHDTASQAVYQRSFTHSESQIRFQSGTTSHQPGSGREIWFS
jgi:hypothetical protein